MTVRFTTVTGPWTETAGLPPSRLCWARDEQYLAHRCRNGKGHAEQHACPCGHVWTDETTE